MEYPSSIAIAFAESNDYVVHFDLNSGNMLNVNTQTCQSLGFTNDELLTRNIFDVLIIACEPNTSLKHLLANKVRLVGEHGILLRKDGGAIHVELLFLRLSRNEEMSWFLIAWPLDKMERNRISLWRHEQRYKELFEDTPVPILDENWSRVHTYIGALSHKGVLDIGQWFNDNPAAKETLYDLVDRFERSNAILHYYGAHTTAELNRYLTGANISRMDLDGFVRAACAFHAGENSYEYEAEEVTCDGREIISLVCLSLPARNRKDWMRVIVSVRDITDWKQADEQLRQSQKMEALGQLTGGISHDFNNILSVIVGNAELLKEMKESPLKLIDGIIHASERGAELIHRLLAFSRNQTLQPKTTNVKQLVLNMTELIQRTLSRSVNISHQMEENLWHAFVDSGQLEAALLNLAINARDAMPKGGDLTINCRNEKLNATTSCLHKELLNLAAGDYVVVSVIDDGIGMSPALLNRVFEPFFTTKQEGKGSGLGLSMVYGFAKQSDGAMVARSEEGKGSTMSLYLPRSGASPEAPKIIAQREPVPIGHGESVLIVEEDQTVQEILENMLYSLNYKVSRIENSEKARVWLKNSKVELILINDQICTVDSSFLQELMDSENELGIILMTANKNQPLISTQHAVPFIKKPFIRSELARVVSLALTEFV